MSTLILHFSIGVDKQMCDIWQVAFSLCKNDSFSADAKSPMSESIQTWGNKWTSFAFDNLTLSLLCTTLRLFDMSGPRHLTLFSTLNGPFIA